MAKREKHVYSSFSDLAHLFANTPDKVANCRNGILKNNIIYSYGEHFPIASMIQLEGKEKIVLFTRRGYSSTTGSHIHQVNAATSQYKKIYTWDVVGQYYFEGSNGFWKFKSDFVQMVNFVTEQLEKFKRARNNKEWIIVEIRQRIREVQDLIEYFEVKDIPEEYIKVLNTDTDALYKKLEEWKEKEKKRLEDPKLAEKREKAKLARERAFERENAEQIQKWRNFEAYTPYKLSARRRWVYSDTRRDLLRYNASEQRVETSQNVKIPVELAHKFYRYIQVVLQKGAYCYGPETCNYKLLNYEVTKIDNECIRVGCHIIPQSEVNLIAQQLNW